MENKGLFMLGVSVAFLLGMLAGSVLTAIEFKAQIEAMGNIFDKITVENINVDLNETEIVEMTFNYMEKIKEQQDNESINDIVANVSIAK